VRCFALRARSAAVSVTVSVMVVLLVREVGVGPDRHAERPPPGLPGTSGTPPHVPGAGTTPIGTYPP
jgi:hypothetical protein